MSTLLRTRRMPAKYCLRKSGITEIVYSATPEVVVVLPGTRWLEERREREARLGIESPLLQEETLTNPERAEPIASPFIDTELAELDFAAEDGIAPEFPCLPEEMSEIESLTWTDRMRIATTKLIRRQNPWLMAQA